ncbi:MAG: phosphoglycerate kinase [Candidatus Jorgensenbacteria bacterium]|nr:phosphoglycerate kinase [Candidatus Jorgensenbacteria bacterium]
MIKFLNDGIAKKYKGKTCVLRVDLNVDPKSDEGMFRLRSVLPTIKLLRKNKVRVVLVSHKGRPALTNKKQPITESKKREEQKILSLKPFTKILENEIGEQVSFLPVLDFQKANDALESAKQNIFLLENIRFCVGEEKNDEKLAKHIAELGDIYVNDAFAVSHRAHASVSAITKFLPHFGGLQLEKEINNLKGVMAKSESPFLIILGGAKTSDKLPLIERFWKKADMFLVAGGPGNTMLAAQGIPMGDSIYDPKLVMEVKKYAFKPNVFTQSDAIGAGTKILDIGPETAEEYSELIRSSKTIIWNGPVGLFEKKQYSNGTKAIWSAVLENKKATIIVGGGETIASAKLVSNFKAKLSKRKNIFLSTGGGAMLEYLSGKKLPGMDALNA